MVDLDTDTALRSDFNKHLSRDGNRWLNGESSAIMKRFFLNLKMERVWRKDYAFLAEATNDIADYIVGFYNSTKLHSKLENMSPMPLSVNRH